MSPKLVRERIKYNDNTRIITRGTDCVCVCVGWGREGGGGGQEKVIEG